MQSLESQSGSLTTGQQAIQTSSSLNLNVTRDS